LSEIVGPFLFSILLFTGLFMSADNLLKILDYASKGVPAGVLLQFFLLALPPVLALVSPIAILLATLLGFGRLSGDSELTAVSAAGVPFERVMVPVAAFAFIVSCVGMYINSTVVPLSQRGRQAIINGQKQKAGQLFGGAGFTYRKTDASGKLSLLVHSEGPLATIGAGKFRLTDVTVTHYTDGKPVKTIGATTAEGNLDSADWVLWGVVAYGRDENGGSFASSEDLFKGVPETLATPEALLTSARPNDELTTGQLQEKARILRSSNSDAEARGVEVEMARRIMVPLGSFIFALVGAPLGVTPNRASKGVGFGYSILITFLYWILLQFASTLGQNGSLPPVLAVALPNIAGIMLGIYLIKRVRR
ncbi:MAG: LptF/LptG family permease, partial [Akkermansiaceae bacterium]|nr:LptF/LptG family permease [Armatimonadota bacterium]